eukprot:s87_g4.t1
MAWRLLWSTLLWPVWGFDLGGLLGSSGQPPPQTAEDPWMADSERGFGFRRASCSRWIRPLAECAVCRRTKH